MRGAGIRPDLVIVILLALHLPASQVAGQEAEYAHAGQATSLAPGDAVRIRAWREPQLNGDYQVDETGMVVLPLLGSVPVSGRDLRELKSSLLEGFATELRNQEIEITFLRRVSVLGGVNAPGLYLIDPTMALPDVVALAGGATESGKLAQTRVVRAGTDVTRTVSLSEPLLTQMTSGDQIVVPEKSWLQRNAVALLATIVSSATIIYAATIND